MKALVTGGAGFIGSNLTQYLSNHGWEVTVVDDLSSGVERRFDKSVKFFSGSLGDADLLDKLVVGQDVVFHLAATGIIKLSIENPPAYFENNLINGVKLLEAMRKHGVKKIIYSSSSGVYGEPARTPIKEDDPTNPINPYGATKLIFEHVLSSYVYSFGIDAVCLRYYNVYGPGDEQRPLTRAVPTWIKAALNNEPLTLFWGGQQKKDYIYVEDVAKANMMVAEQCRGFNVYNVGSGEGVLILDLAKKLEQAFGKNLKIQQMGDRPGDPSILIADISKIKKELGWEPKIDLETGLNNTIAYYEQQIKDVSKR